MSLIRDDSSITVWQSASDELVELDRADGITAAEWLSASVYKPQNADTPLLFALAAEGALRVGYTEMICDELDTNNANRYSSFQI